MTLKTLNESLREKLSQTAGELVKTGEEKDKFKEILERLEREKKEVEDNSNQQENKISQLIKSKEEVILV